VNEGIVPDSETADELETTAIVDIVADVRERPSATFAVRTVMSATSDRLADVDGIGVGAAASISRAIGDEPRLLIERTGRARGRDWQGRRGRVSMTG